MAPDATAKTAWLDLLVRVKAMVCANGETVEYVLMAGDAQIAGPVWTTDGPAAALRTLLTGVLRG